MKFLRRLLMALPMVVLLIVVVAAVALPILQRRSYPQVDGEIRLPGLDGQVDVYRDAYGVPHIYATTEHDLFMVQGYVQAQERFWQMDFWRHQSVGRLSELLGSSTVEVDKYLQTLGWERVAQQEYVLLDSASKAILQAFTDGINAYLEGRDGAELSYEYVFLNLVNPGYEPAPWQPHETLAWGKAMAWDLRGNMDTEIDRALLLANLSPEELDLLYPPYDFAAHPVIVTEPHITGEARLPSAGEIPAGALPALARVRDGFDLLDTLRGAGFGSAGFGAIGSNSWAVSGDLTATGMPLFANDPHLSAQIPSIWFEIGLHCAPVTPDCSYNVTGFTFANVPGVVIGHNDRIAWGFTNLGPDVMDLYIEKINPENPNQYEVNGEWVDMELVPVTINVAGGEPIELTVRYTRHGPVMSDVSLSDFGAEAGIDLPEDYAISLKWTALQVGYIFRSVWKINQAQNWEQFRDAARDFSVPSQNLLYADVDGNIGYQAPGRIPGRNPGHDGLLPVPGWTDEYEWLEYIPFEWLPFAYNPPEGFIVTANNAIVGPEYPFTISRDWDHGFRAGSIIDDILNAPGPIDIDYMIAMQGNDRNPMAEKLVSALLDVQMDDDRLQEIRSILADWDQRSHMDSPGAAIFEVFWKNLLALAFADDLPEGFAPGGGSTWFVITSRLLDELDHDWWDDANTEDVEDRDAMLARAFAAAVAELEERLGRNPDRWAWGDLHVLNFEHDVMSNFPGISLIFNEGPFRTSGGSAIVNATGWSARGDGYEVGSLPSLRMIVDLSDMANSLSIHTTGQSGHAGHPHYIDMADPWRLIEYKAMLWGREAVEAAAESHVVFLP
ncbi:MAG TPA: penicillin acylase family protein [Anaerolineales bacterium]|nr:penicillin acylase family protein [Anaerolineales bacterium]